MSSPNTLFLLCKHGLKLIDKKGICESAMWSLTEDEKEMKYLSLHRSKSDRAYKGGEILDIRQASEEEIREHYQSIKKSIPESTAASRQRMIITFQIDRDWDVLWPEEARANPMAHKGTGHILYEAAAQ
ncbi:MAG: hypothetical protein AAF404_16660 [Pseudomonadota bacterium]